MQESVDLLCSPRGQKSSVTAQNVFVSRPPEVVGTSVPRYQAQASDLMDFGAGDLLDMGAPAVPASAPFSASSFSAAPAPADSLRDAFPPAFTEPVPVRAPASTEPSATDAFGFTVDWSCAPPAPLPSVGAGSIPRSPDLLEKDRSLAKALEKLRSNKVSRTERVGVHPDSKRRSTRDKVSEYACA